MKASLAKILSMASKCGKLWKSRPRSILMYLGFPCRLCPSHFSNFLMKSYRRKNEI